MALEPTKAERVRIALNLAGMSLRARLLRARGGAAVQAQPRHFSLQQPGLQAPATASFFASIPSGPQQHWGCTSREVTLKASWSHPRRHP